MNIRVSVKLEGMPAEAKQSIRCLIESCWGEDVAISDSVVEATFESALNVVAFAKGLRDIERKHNL